MARYEAPSPETVAAAARRVGLTLSPEAAAMFARCGAELAFAYHRVDELEEYLPSPNPVKRTFAHPAAGENKFGAWLVKSSIRRDVVGKLTGQARCHQRHGRSSWPANDRRHRLSRSCAALRCDHRQPHPRCRRRNRGQGGLRISVLFERQPHRRQRSGGKSGKAGLFDRRLLVGQRGFGCGA